MKERKKEGERGKKKGKSEEEERREAQRNVYRSGVSIRKVQESVAWKVFRGKMDIQIDRKVANAYSNFISDTWTLNEINEESFRVEIRTMRGKFSP